MSQDDAGRQLRLLVVASTFPAHAGDSTPGFVRDLAEFEAEHFETHALVPMVPDALAMERDGRLLIRRFRYLPRRWETLAHGAILENLKARPSRWLQVLPLILAEAVALRREVRRFRPHVLHVHWLIPQGLAACLAAPRVPRVVTTLGGDVYALNGWLMRLVKRVVLRGCAGVTAMNEDMRQRLIHLGAPEARTHLIPMGAVVDTMREASAGTERHGGRILFVGRLAEKKGVDVLLRALQDLDPSLPWQIDIVGDGPLRAELQKLAKSLGSRVTFLGALPREDVARALASCDVFVLPSVTARSGDQEGLPLVLLEAMGAGCAIVASRLPGIKDVIDDERTGLLVTPSVSEELTRAIDRTLTSPSLRTQLGAAAQQASEAYSVEAIGRRHVELLHQVVEEEQRGTR